MAAFVGATHAPPVNRYPQISSMTEQPSTEPRLQHFPVSLFAMVMGLSGFTLATEKLLQAFAISWPLDGALALLTLALFAFFAGVYLIKWRRHPEAVAAEINHPVKMAFVPTISISLILLAAVFTQKLPGLSHVLWFAGVSLHLVLLLYVVSSWMHQAHFQLAHLNPAWFIPAVGNVIVPIAGVAHGHVELSWFFFGVGITFWLVLFAIVLNRILFHDPLPEKLLPTLFILIAPPAIGFVAYSKLSGPELDGFARVLYAMGLFLTLLLLAQGRRFAKLPFFLSWWAYSFPLAAITSASFVMAERTGVAGYASIATVLYLLMTALFALLIGRTVQAAKAGKICAPD